jgi:GTP-binding protein
VTPGAGLAGVEIEFVGSFPDPLVRLTPPLPEVGFIGRSNVGKSSLLNALVGRRKLARVSATPGKTTLLNAYRLSRFYLLDLPGYGFARASKAERGGYRRLIERFLRERATLTGIAWLLDSRHEPSKADHEIQELLIESGRPALLVLTKADKLGRAAQRERVRSIGGALGLPEDQIQLTSAHTGLGIGDLAESILSLVG